MYMYNVHTCMYSAHVHTVKCTMYRCTGPGIRNSERILESPGAVSESSESWRALGLCPESSESWRALGLCPRAVRMLPNGLRVSKHSCFQDEAI